VHSSRSFLFLFFPFHRDIVHNYLNHRHRRREVLFAVAIHRQALPTGARPDHRGGIRFAVAGPGGRSDTGQVADLGYRRAGIVPVHHEELLPRGGRCAAGVRYHAPRHLPAPRSVAGGGAAARATQHGHPLDREQERPGGPESREHRRGTGLRRCQRLAVLGNVGQDGLQRGTSILENGTRDSLQDPERRNRHLQ